MACLLPLPYDFEQATGAIRLVCFLSEEQPNITARLDYNFIGMRPPENVANSIVKASSVVQCCRTELSYSESVDLSNNANHDIGISTFVLRGKS
jgi:hypothetical protein